MVTKKYGYPLAKRDAAKSEAITHMSIVAAHRGMVTYSELASNIKSIHFGPHDKSFHELLGETQWMKMRQDVA